MSDLGAKATPRPWVHYRDKLRPQVSTRVNEIQVADAPPIVNWSGFDDSNRKEPEHAANARFIVYAVNHIEATAARLAEAERLLGDARKWVPGASKGLLADAIDAFLRDAGEEGAP